MTKSDLRARVYQAADELFIESGSLHAVGRRSVRERAKGGSNDIGPLLDDWRVSREAMLASRPAALAAIADDFAGRIWLMAKLLSGGAGEAAEPAADAGSPARQVPRSKARAKPPVPNSVPAARRGAPNDPGLFSRVVRPKRPVKAAGPSPQRTASINRFRIQEGGKKLFKLVDPKPPTPTVALSEADWQGAKNERCAEAAATILRKNGDRLRAFEIYKKLPRSLQTGSMGHAQRDLKKAFAGSRIEWSPGGWFWFEGEALPKHRERLDTAAAERRHKGEALWWRMAQTIAGLGRNFTQSEIEDACGKELEYFGQTWLRLRLMRARERKPPFLELVSPGIMRWTGLDPEELFETD